MPAGTCVFCSSVCVCCCKRPPAKRNFFLFMDEALVQKGIRRSRNSHSGQENEHRYIQAVHKAPCLGDTLPVHRWSQRGTGLCSRVLVPIWLFLKENIELPDLLSPG